MKTIHRMLIVFSISMWLGACSSGEVTIQAPLNGTEKVLGKAYSRIAEKVNFEWDGGEVRCKFLERKILEVMNEKNNT